MKKILFILRFTIIALVMSVNVFASTNYYFDATNGNDSGAGTQADPFKTLAKLDLLTLNAGDTVYLKKGEIWYESVTPNTNGTSGAPVTFDAYGSGDLPIISGANFINGTWVSVTNNEYKISMLTEPYVIFKDNTWLKNTVTNNQSSVWSLYAGTTYYRVFLHNPKAVFDNENGIWNKLIYNSLGEDSLSQGEWYYYEDDSAGTHGRYELYVNAGSGVDLTALADGYIYTTTSINGSLDNNAWFYDRNNQELFIKIDSGLPQNNEINYINREHAIIFNDKAYVTIKNIRFEKADENVYFSNTTNQSNVIIDSIEIYRYGIRGILFTSPNNIVTDNITIKDSTLKYAAMKSFDVPSAEYLGHEAGGEPWAAIYLRSDDYNAVAAVYTNILIQNNLISGYTTGSGGNKSSRRDGIWIDYPDTVVIEKNEVTGIDHGIRVVARAGTGICPNVVFRYNYVHDISDDFILSYGCEGPATDFKIYYNKLVNGGDDGIVHSVLSNAWIVNNTIYNVSGNCFGFNGTGSVVVNNLCVRTTLWDSGNLNKAFVNVSTLSGHIINNNLYFNTAGYGNDFAENDIYMSFAVWQALTDTPDADSLITDPNFNSDYIPISPTPAFNMGQDVCSTLQGTGVLKAGSTWPSNVQKIGVCPASDIDKLDVGAYRIRRLPY